MATVICTECGYPDERSFYRGYRLAEDRSNCHKAKLRRYKRGVDRYWRGNECGKHWPPVVGSDMGTRLDGPGYCWRWHDYECPVCHERFCATEWKDKDGLWPEQRADAESRARSGMTGRTEDPPEPEDMR